jgi:hypothetical protein
MATRVLPTPDEAGLVLAYLVARDNPGIRSPFATVAVALERGPWRMNYTEAIHLVARAVRQSETEGVTP